MIGDIKTLTLSQSNGVAFNAISDSTPNGLTVKSGMGSNNEVVTTRMVSIFFNDPSPVTVDGIAVLDFVADGGRRLVRFGAEKHNSNRRVLEDSSETPFSVEVELAGPTLSPSMMASVQPSGLPSLEPSGLPSIVPSVGDKETSDGASFNPNMASIAWMTGAIMMVVAF